jgi:hypothetical protein
MRLSENRNSIPRGVSSADDAIAGDGRKRGPFTGKIVDEGIFGKPACKILVDATQTEQIAGTAILHLGVEQGIGG